MFFSTQNLSFEHSEKLKSGLTAFLWQHTLYLPPHSFWSVIVGSADNCTSLSLVVYLWMPHLVPTVDRLGNYTARVWEDGKSKRFPLCIWAQWRADFGVSELILLLSWFFYWILMLVCQFCIPLVLGFVDWPWVLFAVWGYLRQLPLHCRQKCSSLKNELSRWSKLSFSYMYHSRSSVY